MPESSSRINLIDRLNEKMQQDDAKSSDPSLVERAMNQQEEKPAERDRAANALEASKDTLDPPAIDSSSWHASESGRSVELDFARMHQGGFLTPDSQRSKLKEQYRAIKRPLLINAFQRTDGTTNPHIIMVTSASPNEGKTFTATNLAMSIAAEQEVKVLLVDGDVIRQDLSQQFGVANRKGYLDILRNDGTSVSDIIVRTNIPSLALLPCGQSSENATELFASTRMSDLMQDLASRYNDRVIIVDTPPVLVSSETQTLGMHAGQFILVVEAGETPRRQIEEALSLLPPTEHVFCILNKANENDIGDRYGYYKSYYYAS